MKNWSRTYDFADSRNLQGDDARVERNIQRNQLAGPSSPIAPKKSSQSSAPSASAVRASHEKVVGGGHKRCSLGKSCSATCISKSDKCLVDFPEPVSDAVGTVRNLLKKLVKTGEISQDQASEYEARVAKEMQPGKREVERNKAFDEFSKMLKDGKVSEEEKDFVAKLLLSVTLTPGQDRNAARVLSYDEVNSILKPGKLEALDSAYKASFVSGKFDPSAPGGMGEYIQKNVLVHKISDEVAERAYYMLPSKVRSAIDRAGAVNQMFAGYAENGEPIYSATPTSARGIFLVKRWGEQGGIDPYTGKPIDIRNAEPEHMVAYKHAQAKGGGGGDQPNNLTWSAAQPNNNKAGAKDDFIQWKDNLERNKALGKEKYDEQVYNPAQSKSEGAKGKKGAAPTELEAAMAQQTSQQRVETIKSLMTSYGDEFRYLLRAAGVGWQHQDRDLDHRKGGKPAFMDMDIPKLPGYTVKPSMAVMVALSAVDPSRRTALLRAVENLRLSRIFTDAEAESVKGDNDARLALKKQKSAEYANELVSTLEQYVPNLGSIL